MWFKIREILIKYKNKFIKIKKKKMHSSLTCQTLCSTDTDMNADTI